MALPSLAHVHHRGSPNTTVDASSSSSSTQEAEETIATSFLHPQTTRQSGPGHEEDSHSVADDDHDPSRWVDIEPTSSSLDDNSAMNTSSRRWRRGGSSIIKLHIPSFLCDCISFFWDWTSAAVEIWMEVLAAPPFPLETLQKVSIVLLGVEKIRDKIDQSTLIVFVNPDGSPMNALNAPSWTLASLPHYLIWGIPGLLALLSVSFVLTLQLSWGHQEEAVIATALILLIFLEALLPLFILGCTSMFLFQQVSWETGLLLLVIVWLGSTFCAHCIRRMLYQSLGHG